jgi:hypothetical protein
MNVVDAYVELSLNRCMQSVHKLPFPSSRQSNLVSVTVIAALAPICCKASF